jgi:Ca2+-binding RTX toxin-like protein
MLSGTVGSDVLIGLAGSDTLIGRAGSDRLFGRNGDDRFVTRDASPDQIRGGPGHDVARVDPLDEVRSARRSAASIDDPCV